MAALRRPPGNPRRERGDRGAAAVEFALVVPILLVIAFGIINYGMWFADSLSVRQAARDVARNGAVENFAGGCTNQPFGLNPDMANLACAVQNQASLLGGTAYTKVGIYSDPSSTTAAPTWATGVDLRVCVTVVHSAILPLVPLPNGGISHTKVDIPIESAQGANVAGRIAVTWPVPPPGTTIDWSWCP